MSYFFSRKFNRVDVVWITVASVMAGAGRWLAFGVVVSVGLMVSILGEIALEEQVRRAIEARDG